MKRSCTISGGYLEAEPSTVLQQDCRTRMYEVEGAQPRGRDHHTNHLLPEAYNRYVPNTRSTAVHCEGLFDETTQVCYNSFSASSR